MSNLLDSEVPMGAIAGTHLLIDGSVRDTSVFTESNLHELMIQLARDLDMQIIYGPHFKHVELEPEKLTGDKFQDEGGLSGFCMISTSHISIHVWPLRQAFMMDIFSCSQFDAELATDTTRKFLNPERIITETLFRSPETKSIPSRIAS